MTVLARGVLPGVREQAADHIGPVNKQINGLHTGQDIDPERLGPRAQPAAKVGQTHDIGACVLQRRGHMLGGHLDGGIGAGQQMHLVPFDRHLERIFPGLPVREQFIQGARLKYHRAREHGGADLRAFFQHADRDLSARRLGELLEANCAG